MNRLVEKWSGIAYFVIGKVTPVCWIFPIAITSYFLYFVAGLANEPFELPLLFW